MYASELDCVGISLALIRNDGPRITLSATLQEYGPSATDIIYGRIAPGKAVLKGGAHV
jgi:hypothetical protein